MKRNAFLLACMIACALPQAQAGIRLGYCNDNINPSFVNASTTGNINVAICLPPEQLADYKNLGVNEVHLGINSLDDVTSLKVWVRSELCGTNLREWEVDPAQAEPGWLNCTLDEILPLETLDSLYLGCEYTQSAKSKKVIGSSGSKCDYCFFGGLNNKWKNYSNNYSPLCIYAVLGAVVPHDLKLTELSTDNRTQLLLPGKKAKPLQVKGSFINNGIEPIEAFTIRWKDGAQCGEEQYICHVPSCESADFELEVQPSLYNQANAPLQLTVALPEGVEDAHPDNNSGTLYYDVYEAETMAHARQFVLLEQYTSLYNGYCMIGKRVDYVQSELEKRTQGPKGLVLTQHQGYGPADSLRVTDNNPYTARAIFGPEALQYAPALSINHKRVYSGLLDCDTLMTLVDALLTNDLYVYNQIEATATYDDAQQQISLHCTVTPVCNSWCSNPVVVACLVKDTVELNGRQKDYFLDTELFEETNVVRGYFTPASGESLLLIDGKTLSEKQRDDIWHGKATTPEVGTVAIDRTLQVKNPLEDLSEYHVVVYVCEMTADSQAVDAVAVIPVER